MVPVEIDNPISPHLAQLRGHGATVHSEMVGQFLTVQRYEEIVAACAMRLVGEVCAYLLPSGPLGYLIQSLIESEGIACERGDDVPDEAGMESAG